MRHAFKLLAAAAAAVLLSLAGAAPANQQAPAATSGETIAIPFDPPLERPLRYRRTKEVTKAGQTQSTWTLDEYSFSRREDGFRLHVRPIDTGMDGGDTAMRDAYLRAARRFNRPYILLLDERGAIVGMEDEEAFWAEMLRATEQMVREAHNPTTPAERAAVDHMVGLFRNPPPEARLATIAEAAAPIVEFGSVELTPGEALTNEVEGPGLFGVTVRHQLHILPERIQGGLLFIRLRSSVPREDLIRNVEALFARIPITGQGENTEAGRARSLAELRSVALTRETDAHYEVAIDTGLTRRHHSVERVDATLGSRREQQTTTIIIEQVD